MGWAGYPLVLQRLQSFVLARIKAMCLNSSLDMPRWKQGSVFGSDGWIRWSDQVFFVTQICVVLSWKSEGLIVQCMLIACYNVFVALFCIFLSSIVALSWLFKHRQHIQQLLVTYNFDTEQCRLTKQMWLTLWMSDLVFLFHIFGVMTPDW